MTIKDQFTCDYSKEDTLFWCTASAVAGVARMCDGTARDARTHAGPPCRAVRDQSHTLSMGFTTGSSSWGDR